LFKKLHPKYGNLPLQIEMLNILKEQYLQSDDTDRMFYVKQLQEKVDFLEIKIQIQLSGSPEKPLVSAKT
jgi:hypothetical protein